MSILSIPGLSVIHKNSMTMAPLALSPISSLLLFKSGSGPTGSKSYATTTTQDVTKNIKGKKKFKKESKQQRVTVKPLNSRKTFLIDYYKHLMESNSVILFLHYNNLLKQEDHFFRAQVKQTGGTLTKIRNRLFQVYLKNSKREDPCAPLNGDKCQLLTNHPLLPIFKGPTAAITFKESIPVNILKLSKVLEKAKSQDKLFIIGAQIDGQTFTLKDIKDYQMLPSKEQLNVQLVQILQSLSGVSLVQLLQSAPVGLVSNLESHVNNKPSSSSEGKP
ncbi:mitochondrial 54S ribosomal protein uL10m NDAI_0E03320 [Naumovozyma dairenensis CBS 421]|uniref:Ribosomal protein L10 n=1 Tax=Naumovozyma dairenensis (strain ATCC 10597 / BCRC 20456 / CBS 421 / NBRC 0211 / NRRL Y-12639) TaxID=1071378 RepID=G0WBM9_NAUDC|nr:hypothetical protein NDAI_0E03320 [Naumovozyma dairenensis CBS 421]CCD25149.1 hypothetical protein NDAI_0E03320 [Naumovozyma dairenensis CBS 421]